MTYEKLYKICSKLLKEWPKSTDAGGLIWNYMVGTIDTENSKKEVPLKRFKSLIQILNQFDLWDDLDYKDKEYFLKNEDKILEETKSKIIKRLIKEELQKIKLNEMNSFERKILDGGYTQPIKSNIQKFWKDMEPGQIEAEFILYLMDEYDYLNGREAGSKRISELKEYFKSAFKVVEKWIEENEENY